MSQYLDLTGSVRIGRGLTERGECVFIAGESGVAIYHRAASVREAARTIRDQLVGLSPDDELAVKGKKVADYLDLMALALEPPAGSA